MATCRADDLPVVPVQVNFVGDLHQHVPAAALQQPVRRVSSGAQDGLLVLQALILAEVEVAHNGGHAQLVRPVQDAAQAAHVVLPQAAVRPERGVMPGLFPAVGARVAPLQVDGEAEQPVLSPLWHGCDELRRVALRIPWAVGVVPHGACLRVQVVEDPLHHARVRQQPFHPHSIEHATCMGEGPVDPEVIAVNRHDRAGGHGSLRLGRFCGWRHRGAPFLSA